MTVYDDGRTVTGLVRDLTDQIGRLVRNEFALMKAEASEKASQAGRGAALMAIGGVLALGALLVFLGSMTLLLGEIMALWLAALIVAVATGLIAFALIASGKASLKPQNLAPNRTLSSVRDDMRFTKAQVRRSA